MLICCEKRRQFFWLNLSSLAIILFSQLIAGGAEAIEYGGIGGRPAYPRADNPRTESIFIHTLEPGEIKEEGVSLVNNTSETKTLLVYAVDSVVSSGGAFACRQQSEPQESVGAWIMLGEGEVILEPSTNRTIPFTIAVPQNASAGEHNGCIVVQEKKEKDPGQTGVSLSFRTGLRVAVTVPGDITRKLEIAGFKIEKNGGSVVYHPSVKNIGNVSIDADVKIATAHFLSLENSEYGGQYPILRDELSDWNFEVKKPFWGGFYRAAMTVEYEEGIQVEIGKENGNNKIVLVGPSAWYFVPPTFWAFLIELSVLFLIIFLILACCWYHKRKKWIRKNWVDYTVKANEDIRILAAKFSVSWKLLAKTNKISAPYTLSSGLRIKVPPKK